MSTISRRFFVQSILAVAAYWSLAPSRTASPAEAEKFVCPPCGCSMDNVEFDAPGQCPACGMPLKPKRETDLGHEPASLAVGAGVFHIKGGTGAEEKTIHVHYYLPQTFTPASRILLIVPGAGRDSDEYRNAWLAAARREGVLIAALGYPQDDYDFAAYHMGGVIKNLTFENLKTGPDGDYPSVIHLRDEDIRFDLNPRPDEWLFNDFDRIFGILAAASGAKAQGYDIFGHSAGGQILHRFALFHPQSRAQRIIAANSGFYTLPDLNRLPPAGLKGTGVTEAMLADSFSSDLTIFLGEADDGDEAGGTLLHTPLIDEQGLGRYSRGKTFYRAGREAAGALGVPFAWRLKTVPDVGHDFQAMSYAAAELLYP